MKHLVGYQREVYKGKLTAVASFEKLTSVSPSSEKKKLLAQTKGSHSKRQFSKLASAVNFSLSTSR